MSPHLKSSSSSIHAFSNLWSFPCSLVESWRDLTQPMGSLAAGAAFSAAASSFCILWGLSSPLSLPRFVWPESKQPGMDSTCLPMSSQCDPFQAKFFFPVFSGWEVSRKEWTVPGMDYTRQKSAGRQSPFQTPFQPVCQKNKTKMDCVGQKFTFSLWRTLKCFPLVPLSNSGQSSIHWPCFTGSC